MIAVLDKLKTLSTEEIFKAKSKAMALNLLDECYDVVTSHDAPAPFSQKIEMLKTVAKFADLEPKADRIPIGVGFSIKVVYSGAAPAHGAVTIDQEIGEVPEYLVGFESSRCLAQLEAADDQIQDPGWRTVQK